MKLLRFKSGIYLQRGDETFRLEDSGWDELLNRSHLFDYLTRIQAERSDLPPWQELQPPIVGQEVWAAGVTYKRSREARKEESFTGGGGDFYDKVYAADRPELFVKSLPHKVVGWGGMVRVRGDSKWTVPEPELTILIQSTGQVVGYTVGNDVSARDIEGENPLYLPQAKIYDESCALGPVIWVTESELDPDTEIRLVVERDQETVFEGTTRLSQMKRSHQEMVDFLFRDSTFPWGCFLMTGTGVVPPANFSLRSKDQIRITIEPIGTLVNYVR